MFRLESDEDAGEPVGDDTASATSGGFGDDDGDYDDFDPDDPSRAEKALRERDREELVVADEPATEMPPRGPTLTDDAWDRLEEIYVHFTHASIRDFLTKPRGEETDRRMTQIGICVNSSIAELHLASVCAQAIHDHLPDLDIEFFVECYAGEYLVDHVSAIDSQNVSSEERKAFTQILSHLFFHKTSHSNLIAATSRQHSVHLIFEDPLFVNKVRSEWLARAEEEWFSGSPEEWRWIQEAVKSRKEFIRPWALTAARSWLNKPEGDFYDTGRSVIETLSKRMPTSYTFSGQSWPTAIVHGDTARRNIRLVTEHSLS